jgi:excisionase family DNA binding protein
MQKLLTAKKVCGLLRCGVPTVKRMLKRGELPIVRVGRRVLVRNDA